MDWLERMNRAIDYIEDNLTQGIDYERLAGVAGCSSYHFQRLFSFITDVTLAEYIRRRRLTRAAAELNGGGIKIVDLSVKYGYDSPVSFARAFQKLHGVTPGAARKTGAPLKAFPKMSFRIVLKGDKEMEYRIVSKPAFAIAGKSIRVSMKDGENFRRIPKFWEEVMQDGTFGKIMSLPGRETAGQCGGSALGVCLGCSDCGDEFSYAVAAEVKEDADCGTMERYVIPAMEWVVFDAIGPVPSAIQTVTRQIYSEFFPSGGYERGGGPDIEVYLPGDCNAPDYRCEIWAPVKAKA